MFKFVKRWFDHFTQEIDTPAPEVVKVGYLQPYQDVVNGVVVTKVKFVTDDDVRNKSKVSDYALANLLASNLPLDKVQNSTGTFESIEYAQDTMKNLSNLKNSN